MAIQNRVQVLTKRARPFKVHPLNYTPYQKEHISVGGNDLKFPLLRRFPFPWGACSKHVRHELGTRGRKCHENDSCQSYTTLIRMHVTYFSPTFSTHETYHMPHHGLPFVPQRFAFQNSLHNTIIAHK